MGFRRRLMMAQRSGLPYDSEVLYLQSSGTEYINTGIVPKSGLEIYFEVQGYSSSPSNTVFFGSRTSGTYTTSEDQLYLNLYSSSMRYYDGKDVATLDNNYNKNTSKWCFDKLSYNKNTGTRPITLFAFNNINTINTSMGVCRIGRFKVWDDGVVILDLIPVRKNGVGYMYDRVSGDLFGNDGTGVFTYGADVSYTDLSYISNSNNGYISTQYNVKTLHTKVIVDCEFNGNITSGIWPAPFGSRITTSNYFAVAYPNNNTDPISARIADVLITSIPLPNWNERVTIELGERSLIVDSVNYGSTTSTNSVTYNFPMYAFTQNSNGRIESVLRFIGKIYSLKIYEDGILIHDFIPRFRSDNLFGFWDNVEKLFFIGSNQESLSGQ